MSVISSNRRDPKNADEDDSVRRLKDIYIIKTNNDSDEQTDILDSTFAGIPKIGDSHPKDPLVTVKNRSLRHTKNRKTWEMDVFYSNQSDSSDQGGGGGGGTIIKVFVETWEESYIQEKDFNDELIDNGVKDKLKYEATRYHPQIRIIKDTQDANLQILGEVGKVNDQPYSLLGFTFEKDQLLFLYTAESLGNNVWRENFLLKGRLVPDLESGGGGAERAKGWQAQLLNAGFWEIVDGERVPIYVKKPDGTKGTRPVNQPWPLQVDEAIDRDQIDANREFLQFQTVARMSFGLFTFDFSPVFEPLPGPA